MLFTKSIYVFNNLISTGALQDINRDSKSYAMKEFNFEGLSRNLSIFLSPNLNSSRFREIRNRFVNGQNVGSFESLI